MSSDEYEDLKLQRASAILLSDFQQLLPRLLRKRGQDGASNTIRQQVRDVEMYKACILIEPFQEDPQLLDTHLKAFLPPLIEAYLEVVQLPTKEKPKKGFVSLSHAICFILNLFCKVRGEKVVKGFFNNEPRYMELILHELEAGHNLQVDLNAITSQHAVFPWVERYILLLWLSHLMLAPFPLDSMSGMQSSAETSQLLGLQLPDEAPGIVFRILIICFQGLKSASKERGAAAHLLVRLCVRPDMQNLGLLSALVRWALSFFSKISEDQANIHECLGVLSFLAGLVASATNEEVDPFLSAIYSTCQAILNKDNLAFIKSSAVARKLIVKSLRNIVVHCLQATGNPPGMDTTSVLEEVIEFLLELLADADTPVRYGASKALSIITLKLDPDMAAEIAEAILAALTENVYWQGARRNLNSVNPLQWHGLTLTLSQLLYRKAISTSSLPDVLNALLLSLSFEQRSPTGGSIGTNVRDAACFGLWALSRRYSTADLLAVETSSIRATEHRKTLSVPQVLAIELVTTACLDPAGNIRRGSSAALQELIGRHPNTIEEGISLVQVVDFNAVGLRQRALCDVAIRAGGLHPLYWEALVEQMLEWRGTGSLDSDSRLFTAQAIGQLSRNQSPTSVRRMADRVCNQLAALKFREVEERQGFVSALAALANTAHSSPHSEHFQDLLSGLLHLWSLLTKELNLEDKAITSPALRPEFTASSICNFIGAMATLTSEIPQAKWPSDIPTADIVRLLNLCLTRREDSVLEAIVSATPALIKLLSQDMNVKTDELVASWLLKLENEASYNGLRCSGHAVALGATFNVLEDKQISPNGTELRMRITKVLAFRCTGGVAIEARTLALRALGVLLQNVQNNTSIAQVRLTLDVETHIGNAMHVALNDYTVTERGDVGALVRFEALQSMSFAWASNVLQDRATEQGLRIYANVLRLSLEKIDKIRSRAAQLLQQDRSDDIADASTNTVDDVSSHAYFMTALQMLESGSASAAIKEAICTGFVSSAGMGSESVVQNSRKALVDFLDVLPDDHAPNTPTQPFTLVEFANCMVHLLQQNLTEDRVLLPLLEVIAFLFDMQIMQRLMSRSFNFRTLLSYTQKAHFKSTHMHKLHLALDVYRGLGAIPSTRAETLSKVASMLVHPFPKIRITAAETLWVLTHEEGMKRQDWSLPPKTLKPVVDALKPSLLSSA